MRPDVVVEPPVARKSNAPVVAVMVVLLLAGGAAAYWSSHKSAPAPTVVTSASPPPAAAATPVAQPQVAPESGSNAQLESQLWDSVKNSNDVSVVQSYLDKYPNGTFTAVAKAQLEALKNPAAKPRSAESSMDAEIAAMYKRARANAVDTSALADEQSAWLARRASCGGDPACLRHSYAERRAELSRWITGN